LGAFVSFSKKRLVRTFFHRLQSQAINQFLICSIWVFKKTTRQPFFYYFFTCGLKLTSSCFTYYGGIRHKTIIVKYGNKSGVKYHKLVVDCTASYFEFLLEL
jgi:hypothetical protein